MAGEVINPGSQSFNSSLRARCTYTFTGAAGNGLAGSYCAMLSLAANAVVVVRAISTYCTADLVCAAGTLVNMGTANAATLFIANTDATAILQYYLWETTTPNTTGGIALPATLQNILLHGQAGGNSIGVTPSVHNITGGTLIMDVFYDSISSNASLTSVTGI